MKQNNFGVLSGEYDQVRRGYPQEVFDYLHSKTQEEKNLLDIGCGTGISTRQLKGAGFNVVGIDMDSGMIEKAKAHGGIEYVVAPANKLPFNDSEFDIVAAFTSFHWFTDDVSVAEIKRVLKTGGLFFVALKHKNESIETEAFRNEYKSILSKYVGDKYDSSKDFKSVDVLNKNNLSNIEEKTFYMKEEYTVDEILTLVKSISYWNLVPEESKPTLLKELSDLYTKYSVNGVFTRDQKVSVTIGYKN